MDRIINRSPTGRVSRAQADGRRDRGNRCSRRRASRSCGLRSRSCWRASRSSHFGSSSLAMAKATCSGPAPSCGGMVPPGMCTVSSEPPRGKRSSTLRSPTENAAQPAVLIERLQFEHVAVEAHGAVEVVDIERGFENGVELRHGVILTVHTCEVTNRILDRPRRDAELAQPRHRRRGDGVDFHQLDLVARHRRSREDSPRCAPKGARRRTGTGPAAVATPLRARRCEGNPRR